MTKTSYRDALGSSMNESEEKAIRAFRLAAELLVFNGTEKNPDDVAANIGERTAKVLDADDPLAAADSSAAKKRTRRRKKVYSFIPPLMIIYAQVGEGISVYDDPEKGDCARPVDQGDQRIQEIWWPSPDSEAGPQVSGHYIL